VAIWSNQGYRLPRGFVQYIGATDYRALWLLQPIVFGVIYLKTGSLTVVMILHAVYDALFSLPWTFEGHTLHWLPLFLAVIIAMNWLSKDPAWTDRFGKRP